jgi:hypothetical protein
VNIQINAAAASIAEYTQVVAILNYVSEGGWVHKTIPLHINPNRQQVFDNPTQFVYIQITHQERLTPYQPSTLLAAVVFQKMRHTGKTKGTSMTNYTIDKPN